VDGFGDADPDVEEAEAGDEAADGADVEEGAEGGAGLDEGVVVPDAAPPGKDHDEDAKIDAEEDEDEKGEALEPDGGGTAQRCALIGEEIRRAGLGSRIDFGKVQLFSQRKLCFDLSRGGEEVGDALRSEGRLEGRETGG